MVLESLSGTKAPTLRPPDNGAGWARSQTRCNRVWGLLAVGRVSVWLLTGGAGATLTHPGENRPEANPKPVSLLLAAEEGTAVSGAACRRPCPVLLPFLHPDLCHPGLCGLRADMPPHICEPPG